MDSNMRHILAKWGFKKIDSNGQPTTEEPTQEPSEEVQEAKDVNKSLDVKTDTSSKWNVPCQMGAKCDHGHPDYCMQSTDAYKDEMARRAALSRQFGSRRDTLGGRGDSLSPRFTTDVSGRVIVTGPAPEESESAKASRKLLKDHTDIQF